MHISLHWYADEIPQVRQKLVWHEPQTGAIRKLIFRYNLSYVCRLPQ